MSWVTNEERRHWRNAGTRDVLSAERGCPQAGASPNEKFFAALMCHLVLALPIFALPVLWLLPPGIAVPVYAVTVGISIAAYATAIKVWRLPVRNGIEVLLGATGKVARIEGRRAILIVHGELWSADLEGDPVAVDDQVVVVGFEGFRLKGRICRAGAGARGQA